MVDMPKRPEANRLWKDSWLAVRSRVSMSKGAAEKGRIPDGVQGKSIPRGLNKLRKKG